MKTIRIFFYLSFGLIFASYLGINLAVDLIGGKEINLTNVFSTGLLITVVYSIVYYAMIKVTFKPKFAYLESDEIDEPIFGNKNEKMIAIENESLDIIEIKKEVQKKWIITHFDENNRIIKFRTKISFSSWGIGAVLKIDFENKRIKVISFPIVGYTQKGRQLSKQLIESIEKMTNNVVHHAGYFTPYFSAD